MKQIPYWKFQLNIPKQVSNEIKYAYKPHKPPKPKAIAGTGGFKLKRKHK